MVGRCFVYLSKGQIMPCPTVQWSDSALSNSPIVSQCCVKLSDGLSAKCSTVQWLDCALSNCPMVRQCCFKLSNAWTVLSLIVQELDSAVFFFPTVRWLESAVSSSPSIFLQYNINLCSSKLVCKDNYIESVL